MVKVLLWKNIVHEVLSEQLYQLLIKQAPLNPILTIDENAPATVKLGQVLVNGQYQDPTPLVAADKDIAAATLQRTDHVIINCYEHAVPVPADWVVWRDALRTIAAGGPGPVPPIPPYPAGIGPLLKEPLP
jgi:hypothetical protein